MTSAADTFARFLDVVADSLRDPSEGTDPPATALHLSRSQLDRVVSAVSGETPGQLRRRILWGPSAPRASPISKTTHWPGSRCGR